MRRMRRLCLGLIAFFTSVYASHAKPLLHPDDTKFTLTAAVRVRRAASETIRPTYGPLAEHIVERFDLADKQGIGIDLGSGPGTLIIELCKRTRLHWVNAEINPHFFPYFLKDAQEVGVGHRVSAIFADAQALPFRDNYADILVSRGSFHLWGDKRLAFSEVYRVLKPGGTAFVGRGFSPNLPPEAARQIRAGQGSTGPAKQYDVQETKSELRRLMATLRIKKYRILIPRPPGADDVKYGIWLEFHKPVRNPASGKR